MAREKHFKSARLAGKAMGMAVSTYGAHERAEAPGGRDYGPDEAKKYARRFGVTPEWLLTGREPFPTGDADLPPPKASVVGYVGAGAETHIYDVPPGDLDEVDAPTGSNEATVAVEIRGNSLGSLFNRWLVFYDQVRRPVTSDLIGDLCVVGLEDGRILIKLIQRGRAEGLYNLISQTEAPIRDVAIEWAAKVTTMSPRSRS
jgi:hypothetical protein